MTPTFSCILSGINAINLETPLSNSQLGVNPPQFNLGPAYAIFALGICSDKQRVATIHPRKDVKRKPIKVTTLKEKTGHRNAKIISQSEKMQRIKKAQIETKMAQLNKELGVLSKKWK